jgi:transcription elongation factor Elf1
LSKRVKSIEDKLPRNLACPNCQSENTEKLTEVLGGADDYVCKTCGIYFRGLV